MSENKEQLFDVDLEILKDFIIEAKEGLNSVDEQFILLEQEPKEKSHINAIFRIVHSIKGSSGFFNLSSLKLVAHKMENILDELRNDKRQVRKEIIDILLKGSDCLKSMLDELAVQYNTRVLSPDEESLVQSLEAILKTSENNCSQFESFVLKMKDLLEPVSSLKTLDPSETMAESLASDLLPILRSMVDEQLNTFSLDKNTSAEATTIQKTTIHPEVRAETTQTAMKKTLRVDESTVDDFMYFVGELIISSEVFSSLCKRIEHQKSHPEVVKDFKNAILSFDVLSKKLQKSLMEVRKIPVKNLTSKASKLVRDLAQTLGKQANVNLIGQDVVIDKSLIEILEDPFVHMIRNSIDHGIEHSNERTIAGKPPSGQIEVECKTEGSFFYMLIRDDGAGIDPVKMRRAAFKKGLMSEDQAALLTDQQAQNLIFAPGFSSAEQITDVSGRGVGMDVALTQVKKANGTIDVRSQAGQGTTITVQLPLTVTVMVISVLTVHIGQEAYLVPLDNLREVVFPTPEMTSTVKGTQEIVSYRKSIYTLGRLDSFFENETRKKPHSGQKQIYLLVKEGEEEMFLAVDAVRGIGEVVMKNISDEFKREQLFKGSVILGDGKVTLVMDIKGIMNHFNEKQLLAA